MSNEGPCYYTDVYYDILDDFECLWTIYSFTSKTLAEQFIDNVPFICSDVEYTEQERTDDGHLETHPYRPIFTNLQDALDDAKEFNKHGDREPYKYRGRVFRVKLSVIEKQYDTNTIKKLRAENDELRQKVALLEAQLASTTS